MYDAEDLELIDESPEQMRNDYYAWLLSGNPLNKLIASYITHLSLKFAAEASQLILRDARGEGKWTEGNQWAYNVHALTVGYANLCAVVAEPTYACHHHKGEQEVVKTGGYTGFAGGSCWFAELACGCTIVDESDDERAAM